MACRWRWPVGCVLRLESAPPGGAINCHSALVRPGRVWPGGEALNLEGVSWESGQTRTSAASESGRVCPVSLPRRLPRWASHHEPDVRAQHPAEENVSLPTLTSPPHRSHRPSPHVHLHTTLQTPCRPPGRGPGSLRVQRICQVVHSQQTRQAQRAQRTYAQHPPTTGRGETFYPRSAPGRIPILAVRNGVRGSWPRS